MADDRSDADLVAAANQGDGDALGGLYMRYRDWAVSLAFRFTGDREAALDVMQESFAYFFTKFPGFRLRARVTTFLYPVIKNNALAARRKKRPESAEFEVFEAVEGAPSGSSVAREVPRAALVAAISRLPDGQREVLLMRVVDEMSVEEIALALGIPEGTVKSRMHHAVEAMRGDEALNAYWK